MFSDLKQLDVLLSLKDESFSPVQAPEPNPFRTISVASSLSCHHPLCRALCVGEKPHAFPWCWAISKEGMATSNSLQAQRQRNKGTVTYMYREEGAPSQKNSRLKIHAPLDTDIAKLKFCHFLLTLQFDIQWY
ncbi:hypothetical protein SRHO_G00330250 [Serrasalmus rhombeus]